MGRMEVKMEARRRCLRGRGLRLGKLGVERRMRFREEMIGSDGAIALLRV